MQNFGVTNKQYYGMLRCFLEWSIAIFASYVPMRPRASQPNPQYSLTPKTHKKRRGTSLVPALKTLPRWLLPGPKPL